MLAVPIALIISRNFVCKSASNFAKEAGVRQFEVTKAWIIRKKFIDALSSSFFFQKSVPGEECNFIWLKFKIYISDWRWNLWQEKFVFKKYQTSFVAVLVFAVSLRWIGIHTMTNSACYSSQPEPETIFQDRDMSIYDLGGLSLIVSIILIFQPKIVNSLKKQAREFIYKHWLDKKRAYIILGIQYVDHFTEYQHFYWAW